MRSVLSLPISLLLLVGSLTLAPETVNAHGESQARSLVSGSHKALAKGRSLATEQLKQEEDKQEFEQGECLWNLSLALFFLHAKEVGLAMARGGCLEV